MSKYSKAPWRACGFGVIKDNENNVVARLDLRNCDTDCCLISTAPELLDALKTMLVATDFKKPLPKGHPGHQAYLKIVARPRAKQAIAKAEGK